jgi:CheY-like chemotaxis protein
MARSPFEHLHVLVVDDNGNMRQIIETALHAFGVSNVYLAADSADALEILRSVAIDIVLTDLEMGVLDGFEFVRMVRTAEDSPNPYVPIIVISGHTDLNAVTEARDAGMTEFLAKPVAPKALYERIVSIIRQPRPFIRAKRYFGPDRRRRAEDSYHGPTRREGDHGDGAKVENTDFSGGGGELSSRDVADLLKSVGD